MSIVSSVAAAQSPGVYGQLVSPPKVIRGVSLGYVGYASQLPAGPVGIGYVPSSGDDLVQTYATRGVNRAYPGWYGIIGQLTAPWKIVRVCGGTAGINPPQSVTATVTGTTGASAASWRITALNANGETMGSQTISVSNLNSTQSLSPTALAWSAVLGAVTYSGYRISGGTTQGKIFTAQAGTTFNDNGVAASGSIPVSNASGFAAASLELYATGGSIFFQASSPGVWGNAMTMQIAAASNGDATKRDLIFTITNPVTLTTTFALRNMALNQVPVLTNQYLVGSITWNGTLSAWPASQTYTLQNGSDGATPGLAEYSAAMDQLNLDADVTCMVTDDCGDAIRTAVNGSLITHCTNAYDRVCHITGSKSNALAAALTDKATYNSELATYYGPWVQVFDDSGTNLVDVPLSIFGAVMRVSLPVHWSIANHDPQATKYLVNVKGISTATPYSTAGLTVRGQATQAQMVVPIKGVSPQPGVSGPWQLLHGRDCNLVSGYQYECVTWYRLYIMRVLQPQLDPDVNAPNDLNGAIEIQGLVNTWMAGEQEAGHVTVSKAADGISLLPAYSTDVQSVNSAATLNTGYFFIQINAHHPGVREFIFINLNVGETVSVIPPSN